MYASCRRITIVRLVVASAVLEIFVYTNGTMKIRTGNLKETAEVAGAIFEGSGNCAQESRCRGGRTFRKSWRWEDSLAKACAKAMDIRETVMSPTFVLERVYRIPAKNFTAKRFDHLYI